MMLLLEKARIVERGNHAHLLAACGRYAAMCQLQKDEA